MQFWVGAHLLPLVCCSFESLTVSTHFWRRDTRYEPCPCRALRHHQRPYFDFRVLQLYVVRLVMRLQVREQVLSLETAMGFPHACPGTQNVMHS